MKPVLLLTLILTLAGLVACDSASAPGRESLIGSYWTRLQETPEYRDFERKGDDLYFVMQREFIGFDNKPHRNAADYKGHLASVTIEKVGESYRGTIDFVWSFRKNREFNPGAIEEYEVHPPHSWLNPPLKHTEVADWDPDTQTWIWTE
jgi:hypothetical protein